MVGESEVFGTVVGIVGTSCSGDAGESEAEKNETDGALWTSRMRRLIMHCLLSADDNKTTT